MRNQFQTILSALVNPQELPLLVGRELVDLHKPPTPTEVTGKQRLPMPLQGMRPTADHDAATFPRGVLEELANQYRRRTVGGFLVQGIQYQDQTTFVSQRLDDANSVVLCQQIHALAIALSFLQ